MKCQINLKNLFCISSLMILSACGQMNDGFTAAQWEDSSYNNYQRQAIVDDVIPQSEASENGSVVRQATVIEAPVENENGDIIEEEGEVVFTPPDRQEMEGPGILKPTVYFFAVMNEDTNGCAKNQKRPLYGQGGKKLLDVCSKTAAACSLQGSCGIVQDGKLHNYNIIGRFSGQDRFFEVDEQKCPFGYGVSSSCLDPFYTLAADLTIYKPGEVIYIPSVVGLDLPDGSRHDGYFVIRDRGRAIKGRGRFDFFSGYLSWRDSENPFKKVGLGNVKTNMPYFRISGKTAKKVLSDRAYPNLPENVVVTEIK